MPGTGSVQLDVQIVPRIPTCATVDDQATITVTPKPLTITAPSLTIDAGSALPALQASYSGLVPNDTLAVPPRLEVVGDYTSAGTYQIRASGAADTNYTITYAPGHDGILIGTLTAGADGNVTPGLDVVAAQAGIRQLAFTGRTSGLGTGGQVTVDPAAATVIEPNAGRGAQPILGITPGATGSYFGLNLPGFGAGPQVQVIIDGKPGPRINAEANGTLRVAIYLDSNTRPGPHTVQLGANGPSAGFTVVNGQPRIPLADGLPVAQNTNEVGAPGGYFPFRAEGFRPGETVIIALGTGTIGRHVADANGVVQLLVKFDPNAAPGDYQVTARSTTSGFSSVAINTLVANGPERYNTGNGPVLNAVALVYMPTITRINVLYLPTKQATPNERAADVLRGTPSRKGAAVCPGGAPALPAARDRTATRPGVAAHRSSLCQRWARGIAHTGQAAPLCRCGAARPKDLSDAPWRRV